MADGDYCTWLEVRDSLGVPASSAREDDRIQLAVSAGSRSIDGLCGRTFTQRVLTRTVTLRGPRTPIPDLVSMTAFSVYDTAGVLGPWLLADVRLLPEDPYDAHLEQWPYTAVEPVAGYTQWATPARAVITGTWGWPAVPLPIKQAAVIAAGELWKLKDAPFGVAGFGEYGAVRVRQNPKVTELVRPYVRGSRMLGGL